MKSVQERLGKAIYDYFLKRIAPNENFYLLVDSYTYEYCAKNADLTDEEIEKLLQGVGVYSCLSNDFCALAIAALEVKIAYDVETDSDLINSYNRRLIEKIKHFKDVNNVQNWYQSYQEKLWRKAKDLFKKENRNLIIPEERTGTGRFVQYPLKHRIISGATVIKYADKFIELGLEPNSGITYSLFEQLIFSRNDFNENIRRMVFSFYCMWDGRSYKEIYTYTRVSKVQREQQAKNEFCIRLEPEIQIYINQKKFDFSTDKIDYKYLWKFDENKYLTTKGKVFIQDDDYNDWLPLPRNKAIDSAEDVLLLSQQQTFPKYIESLIAEGKLEIFDFDKYKILLFSMCLREDFEKFGIKLKHISFFSLEGGLKVKHNTYYDFALPAIKLSDTLEDRNYYKSVYVDMEEYPIHDGIANLSKKLMAGKHCVKLFNSWDSSEVYFYVEKVEKTEISESHGWNLDIANSNVQPCCENLEKIIDGLKCCELLQWIERKENSENFKESALRAWQNQNEKLVYRYEKVGNLELTKRARYGNK